MRILEKILVAHDFGKVSENVVNHAIEIAKVFHSKISLIHVLPDDLDNAKIKALLEDTVAQKLEEAGKKILDSGIEVGDLFLKHGVPYDQIALAADHSNVNLVVVGAGASPESSQFRLGTTARRVIQKSDQPVYVVKEGSDFAVERILCPVDLSTTSLRALKNTAIVARRLGAELIILHIIEKQGSAWLVPEKDLDQEKDRRYEKQKEKFEQFLTKVNLTDLSCRKDIRTGDPAELILKQVDQDQIDLLVMGTTGKTGLSRMIVGSVAEKVSREVPCSFMMLKSEDVIQLQLATHLRELEYHLQSARQLEADGFLEEAIEEYKKCLLINSMHVPAYLEIARTYEKIGQPAQARVYRESGQEIMNRIWDKKIEEEIRRLHGQ